jgi:hypothetical protein
MSGRRRVRIEAVRDGEAFPVVVDDQRAPLSRRQSIVYRVTNLL